MNGILNEISSTKTDSLDNKQEGLGLWFMVFNVTFNNISVISWRSVLLVEETRENH